MRNEILAPFSAMLSSKSKMRQTFGCVTSRAVFTSRTSLCRAISLARNSGRTTLIATII